MALTLTIPDSVVGTIKLPKTRLETELYKEMAFTFYERGLTSMGVARRFAKLTKWEFIEGLAERGIQRHYDDLEADEDIHYAKRDQ